MLLGEGIPAAPATEAEIRFPLETFDEDDTDEDDTAVLLQPLALLGPGVRADGVDGIEPVSPSASAAICADCAINF